MGQQIVQQPDGKWAIWSTVSDGFLLEDATELDIVAALAGWAAEDAVRRGLQLIERIKAGEKVYYQFTMTYEQMKHWHDPKGDT